MLSKSLKPDTAKSATRSKTLTSSNNGLCAEEIKQVLLDLGAADVGFVEIDRPELANQKEKILGLYPRTRSIVSFVIRMNRESVRSTARSLANSAFHKAHLTADEIGLEAAQIFEDAGIGALNVNMGFPMEVANFGTRQIWTVSHKPIAVAAGLGMMGLNRNVIHPKFGNFILLGTILLDVELDQYTKPLNFNPCIDCKLCVAACPVGAISPEGHFNFSACMTHNYREFMGGFQDWVDGLVEAQNKENFAHKFNHSENASMWQSLSFGANYKAAYCMAVCPAGDDVIGRFLEDRRSFLDEIVKPLQRKEEPIYVVKGSDAEKYVAKRYPHKTIRRVGSGIKLDSIEGFKNGLRTVFQPGNAGDLNAVYHFEFTGKETVDMTVKIKNKRVAIEPGLIDKPDLLIRADSATWIKFMSNKVWLPIGILTGKIKLKGDPKLLIRFGNSFVS